MGCRAFTVVKTRLGISPRQLDFVDGVFTTVAIGHRRYCLTRTTKTLSFPS